MQGSTRRIAIALGSNLGNRPAHLVYAIQQVRDILTDVAVSSFVESVPQGAAPASPMFLNGALVGTTGRSSRDMIQVLMAIERARGRERPYPGAPRTLDLDLILAGDETVEAPDVRVPHPRFRERLFVLGPLAEIAPDLVDPETGRTVRWLLAEAVASDQPAR